MTRRNSSREYSRRASFIMSDIKKKEDMIRRVERERRLKEGVIRDKK